jgi:hypothetical protein
VRFREKVQEVSRGGRDGRRRGLTGQTKEAIHRLWYESTW